MKTELEKVTKERDIWVDNYKKLHEGYNLLDKKVHDQTVVINESIRVHRLASEKIESLEIKMRELNAELLRLERKYNELEADAKANEMMLKQVCEERDRLKEDSLGLHESILAYEEDSHRLKADLTKLEDERDALRARIHPGELLNMDELATVKQERDALRADTSKLHLRCVNLEQELAALRTDNDRLSVDLRTLRSMWTERTKERDAMRAEVKDTKEKLEAVQTNWDRYVEYSNKERATLREQREAMRAELEGLHTKDSVRTKEHNILTKENRALSENLANSMSTNRQIMATNEKLIAELAEAKKWDVRSKLDEGDM